MWPARQFDPDKSSLESRTLPDLDTSPLQPDKVPDGGLLAWAQVLLTHIVFFNTWGVANGYGIFQQYYTETLGQTESAVSWIGSVQVFLLFVVGVAAGRLTDGGHFRPVFSSGVVLQVLGLFMTSFSKAYWQIFLAQAVCLGIGNGLTFCPALAVLSQYFKKRRAIAVGLAAAGGAVGGFIYPVLIDWLIFKDNYGFVWALRAMGFIMLATYIPCLVWFKPRLPPRRSGPWVDTSAFGELPFIFFSLSMFLHFWGLYFAFFYLGTFARDEIGVTEPIYLLMVLNGVGILGRILPPIIADKWTGSLNILIPLGFLASIVVYCWAAIYTAGGLYVFAVVYGFIAASLQALFPGVATTMTPNPNRTGTRVGMIFGFVSFANLTGPAICGALIRKCGGSYVGAEMFAGSCIFLGAVMALGARLAKTGMALRVKV
ncbi:monocarboxylate permease [Penicillium cataractarum]|uniref:Monocarboxylate permease n=1 Tax=Penicillium cataractarum TaxID=2100454 RepID=A0A9W9V5L2_9EURO|nr:monocarboxylate permease [Penicillium cataractarum]KAJ5369773.1 monocarboxylate permease [Penicillium cataractarum]